MNNEVNNTAIHDSVEISLQGESEVETSKYDDIEENGEAEYSLHGESESESNIDAKENNKSQALTKKKRKIRKG